MDRVEAIKILKEYNKWRRGRGKKYSQPGFPNDLSVKDIGLAIDFAIDRLVLGIPDEYVVELYHAANEHRKATKDGALKEPCAFVKKIVARIVRRSNAGSI